MSAAARTASCIYRGVVRHRRFAPAPREFSYPLRMLYLDLDELDEVFAGRWLWSVERPNWVAWRRRDYLGDPQVPLAEAVRERVERALGFRPAGPVRMLTQLRHLGLGFNPVTFYWCFDAAGSDVEALVAEITNTPWRERHAYVLGRGDAEVAGNGTLRWRFDKVFHVSPFQDMAQRYDWRASAPGDSLAVHIENHRGGVRVFDATLTMERREITGPELARTLLRHPFQTGTVLAAIYWQALRLWLRGTPFFAHPRHAGRRTPAG